MSHSSLPPHAASLMSLAAADILNSLADGVYVTAPDRRIVFWNTAAERITGWTPADVVGKTCYANVLVHIDKDGHQLCGHEHCPLHRSIVTGAASANPVLVFAQRKNGERVPVEVSVAPIRDPAGAIVGGVEVFRDLTEAQRDLLRAKGVQEMTMRGAMPEDSRVKFRVLYQPSEVVGGDFYRVERLGPNLHVALLADAMGHGVAAALHTMLLRSLWDDLRAELGSPGGFLRALNARVHPLVQEQGYFGTAVAIAYDPASGWLRCARAGHPAPLLFRGTGTVESLGESGPGLGLLPECDFAEAKVRLDPGELLLLFSDGAEEIPGPTGAELGAAGLARLTREQLMASAGELDLEKLEEALLGYASQVHLPDDLTLLGIQRCLDEPPRSI